MSYEQQKREIATIKERSVTLKLSDADCERVSKKAGSAGLTVGELLENFIGDLVGGTYSNGSDECSCADSWFDRCWFGRGAEDTLLEHLINNWWNIEYFLDNLDEINQAEKDLKDYKENPKEYDEEEMSYVEEDLQCFRENYHDAVDEWIRSHENADMEKEIELCRKWLADYESLKGEE